MIQDRQRSQYRSWTAVIDFAIVTGAQLAWLLVLLAYSFQRPDSILYVFALFVPVLLAIAFETLAASSMGKLLFGFHVRLSEGHQTLFRTRLLFRAIWKYGYMLLWLSMVFSPRVYIDPVFLCASIVQLITTSVMLFDAQREQRDTYYDRRLGLTVDDGMRKHGFDVIGKEREGAEPGS